MHTFFENLLDCIISQRLQLEKGGRYREGATSWGKIYALSTFLGNLFVCPAYQHQRGMGSGGGDSIFA